MRFGILGATQMRRAGGDVVPVGGPRVRSLLVLLLLNAGRTVTAESLVDGLYGEDPPAGAANALQSSVSRLRRTLRDGDAGGDPVEFLPGGYRLAVDPDDIDARRFERLARDGHRALIAGDHPRAAAILVEALGLWRGPALADVAGAPFAAGAAARLDELRIAAYEDRAEAELATGGHRGLIPELRELVAEHPLRERLRAQLMRALYGAGRPAEALEEYERARDILAEQLGAEPAAELAAVHLAVLRADPDLAPPTTTIGGRPRHEQAPPPRQSPPPPPPYERVSGSSGQGSYGPAGVGLPAQFTTFVGREEELRKVGKLLSETRLVTLLGPGGAGKTRLAVEAAERERAGGRAGGEVRFVDLAPLGDGPEMLNALLEALGLRETGLLPTVAEQPGVERLIAALAERPALLVLDNCEHIIEDAARLVHRLLVACPGLRVLATSREALGITGESLRPLPPLAMPPPGAPLAEALASPAVRLFADRADAVSPGFAVDGGNVDAVLRICAALDGLPLAIELAAARLRTLPVAEIAERLAAHETHQGDEAPGGRFGLLSRGSRTAAPRHRTLRAVVQWSWDLLVPAERSLAARFTAFSGGATLRSVARVCGLPADEADELLASLAEKSLIQADGGRYRMLETIREFCAERLAEAGEADRLHRAHAAYFLDLAESAAPRLRDAGQLEWLARLADENANLHAALRRAIHADPRTSLRLVGALSWFWWLRGRAEGAPLSAALLRAVDLDPPDDLREEYVLCVVNALSDEGSGVTGDQVDLAGSIMWTLEPVRQPYTIVLWSLTSGPKASNAEVFERQLGDDAWSQGLRQMGQGFLAQFRGDTAEAERAFEAGRKAFSAAGDRWGTANALDPLAQLAEQRGDRRRAIALLDEALTLVQELGATTEYADLMQRRAGGLVREGDLGAAAADYERAVEASRRAGAPEKAGSAYQGLGMVARLRGDLAEARRLHEKALDEITTSLFIAGMGRAYVLVGLGWVAEAEGHAEAARDHHRDALTAAIDQENHLLAADAVEGLAGVALLAGEGERAALLLGAARALRGASVPGDPDVARVAAGAREILGDAAYDAAYARGAALPTDAARTLAIKS